MSTTTALWIDRTHAKIFQLSKEQTQKFSLHARHPEHHTHHLDQIDQARQERRFYNEVVPHLASASKILILGPGVAKHHFQNYMIEHFPALSRRVVGCETVDHPTDPQIEALARRYLGIEGQTR